MNRRDLLAGIALASTHLEAEGPSAESLYIPQPHLVEDRTLLHDFMDEYAFAELVTSTPSLRVTHIPVMLDRSKGTHGTIFGHISKKNQQSATFNGRDPALVVFHGPHSYISPAWYTTKPAVPTWNFSTVHASGKLKPITDTEQLHEMLGQLIDKFDHRYGESSYDFRKLPETYVHGMIGGIIGFEMPIENIEGKFKLGQERSEEDRDSIVSHLKNAKEGRSIGELTRSFYDWVKRKKSA